MGDKNTPTVPNPPKVEMVTKTDPKTGETFEMPKQLEIYMGGLIADERNRTEAKMAAKYQPLLDELEKDNSELSVVKDELEKLKEQNLSVDERAAAAAKRVEIETKRQVEEAKEEARFWMDKHQELRMSNDILTSFGDTSKLCNSEQTAILMQIKGNARVEEIFDPAGKGTGKFETRLKLVVMNDKGESEEREGTPKELFKSWINHPDNLHLQINNLNPGGGSAGSNGKGFNNNKIDIDAFMKNPAEGINTLRNSSK